MLIICRINLESGEQTVLGVHKKPVKSVVYSKEHCMHLSLFMTTNTYIHHSTSHLCLLGCDTSFPRPFRSLQRTHRSQTPRKATLPLHHSLQARSSNVFPSSPYLRTRQHINYGLKRKRRINRSQALAGARIIPQVHDQSRCMYAK